MNESYEVTALVRMTVEGVASQQDAEATAIGNLMEIISNDADYSTRKGSYSIHDLGETTLVFRHPVLHQEGVSSL